jgi:hypothetical protein
MKYRIVSILDGTRTVMAEVCSKEWAETFAEDVREWERSNGIHGLFKIVVEEIK